MQRALLQWNRKENHDTIRIALRKAGRPDLIGLGDDCLVPPERGGKPSFGDRGDHAPAQNRPTQGKFTPHSDKKGGYGKSGNGHSSVKKNDFKPKHK